MPYKIPYHRPMITYKGSHMLSNGDFVKCLEEMVRNYYDVEHVIACSSASIGLLIALQTIIGERYHTIDAIATPSFAWFSSAWALKTLDYNIKFIDINKTSWLMNESNSEICMPLHTFGNVTIYNAPIVIYDAAHALGANIRDFGDATVFSLAPTKLVTSCEGGLIATNDGLLAESIRKLRDKVSRMSEPNAYRGIDTFRCLDEILEQKKTIYNYYKRNLVGIFQQVPYSSNYNTIGMLTDLKIPAHIECRKYYEPLDFSLPNTKFVYNKIVCLPSWYGVDYEQITEDINLYNESLNYGRLRVFGDSDRQALRDRP